MTALSTQRPAESAPQAPSPAVRHLLRADPACLRQGLDVVVRLQDRRFRGAPAVASRSGTGPSLSRRGAFGAHLRPVPDHQRGASSCAR